MLVSKFDGMWGNGRSKWWILSGAAAVPAMAYAVRGRSSSILAPSVWRGTRSRRAVALTFDDGPSESTPALLDLLQSFGVKATFFQCGANVQRLPTIAAQVAKAGHEIGNHSQNHPSFQFHTAEFIYRELAAAQDAICRVTGILPRWFRPPFGVRWFGLGEAQRRLGLRGVMWTTLACDWKWPAERVTRRLLDRATDGAIWCLHDGRQLSCKPDIQATLGAVRRLIPLLLDRGFRFEKVSEILCPKT